MSIKMIKDPIHGFIDFDSGFEDDLRRILGNEFFQRLRKVKQLGFSDHVFPSATHTRFAHSLGVYSTARRMLAVVEKPGTDGEWSMDGKACLAAALLHDIGHGMFSHAFEGAIEYFLEKHKTDDTKAKALTAAVDHENVSKRIILETSIGEYLTKIGGNEFPKRVADLISKADPKSVYTSIVTSQLDADRLHYIMRDPYFAGVSSGNVDLDWIMRNLKLSKDRSYLYLDSKAYISMEQFSVTLFQLYPTIYLHKKTRAIEIMFSHMLARIFALIAEGQFAKTGLTEEHPFVKFFEDPADLSNVVLLDDTVLWGSMYQLKSAPDERVSDLAKRISDRDIFSMIDVWQLADEIFSELGLGEKLTAGQRVKLLNHVCPDVCKTAQAEENLWHDEIHYDKYSRQIYTPKRIKGGDPQQINIMVGGVIVDIFDVSPIVASSASFNIHRLYYDEQEFTKSEALIARLKELLRAQISRDINLLLQMIDGGES